MDTDKLIVAIRDLDKTRYIKKSIIDSIKSNLKTIKKHANKDDSIKINRMIVLTSNQTIDKNARNEIITIREPIIKIIKRYEEEYNEESNKDNIYENLSMGEIEELLDEKIPRYSGFSKNHPMEGVSYNKSTQKYQIQYEDLHSTNKSIEIACEKIKEKIGYKNHEIFEKFILNAFPYKDHHFICYWLENKPYFDIQHIIQVLNLKTTSWANKYNEFNDKISYYKWHQNKFGGYILRELIDEKTMYKIILSSNSDISVSFKNDVANILANLRKNGQLQITNNKISIKNSKSNMNQELATILEHRKKPYILSYNSFTDMMYVKHLITMGSNLSVSKYIGKHVLYMFIIPIKTNHRYVIAKIGYSEDIIDRYNTLKSEYKSDIFFIKAKIITGQKDEQKFHDLIKTYHKELIETHCVGSKEKTELYKFSPVLLNLFNSYLEPEPFDNKNEYILTEIDKYFIDEIKQQEIIFDEYADNYFNFTDNTFDEKTRIKYLIVKENNFHQRLMKDKEMEHKERQLVLATEEAELKKKDRDSEIELIKWKIKLAKLTFYNPNNLNDIASENESIEHVPIRKKRKIIKL